jgi:subtilisin family serine protease
MIDAISLSFGYYNESSSDVAYSSALWTVIEKLLDRGVVVVAAAGNNSSGRRYYPAAFTTKPRPGKLPVLSVGALNPQGTRAMFSDDGRWVTAWASGAAVISTFPDDVKGSLTPTEQQPDGSWMRETINPDDFRGGFAQWAGSSFSAPALAARFLRAMLEAWLRRPPPPAEPWRSLKDLSEPATRRRASRALRDIGWKGD